MVITIAHNRKKAKDMLEQHKVIDQPCPTQMAY